MTNVAIDGYCPVAYFLADKPLKGSTEFASDFNGQTYYFVSAEAKSVFEKDKARYIPAFGGSCAFGTSIEEDFLVDPTNFKIVNDRLFLFLKNDETDALSLWNDGNEAELIKSADENFSKK